MVSRQKRSRLLRRDGNLCGIHLEGCEKMIESIGNAEVDHIFTRSFFREFNPPAHVNGDWNCQPMHPECNRARQGQIFGFPRFSCRCHWLKIVETPGGHEVVLCYKGEDTKLEEYVVCAEDKGITRTKIFTGEFADEIGGAAEIPRSSIGTLGNLPPGKEGKAGLGSLGHNLPTIEVDEIPEFNRREQLRASGVSAPTIEVYNKRIPRITVYYSVEEERKADES